MTQSGKRRLAIGVSLLWILGLLFFFEQDPEHRLFLLLGVLPALAAWLGYWVYRGFAADKARARPARSLFGRRGR